ncbi:MAG: hypothetical protein GYB31_20840 [Bacteroidetes bacterium]|nr:hypothetical protein [Bacteroidota bacterium]
MSHEKFEKHLRETLSGHPSQMDKDAFWATLEKKRKKKRRGLFFILFPLGLLIAGLSLFLFWPESYTGSGSLSDAGIEEQVLKEQQEPPSSIREDLPDYDGQPEIETELPEEAIAAGTGNTPDKTSGNTSDGISSNPAGDLPQKTKATTGEGKRNSPSPVKSQNEENKSVPVDSETQVVPDLDLSLLLQPDEQKEPTAASDTPVIQETNEILPALPIVGIALAERMFSLPEWADIRRKPETEAEEAERISSKKWSQYLGLHAGAGAAINQLKATAPGNTDLINVFRKTHQNLEVLNAGIDFHLVHKSGFGLRTGLEYQQFAQKLSWESTTTEEIIDTAGLVRIIEFPDGSRQEEFDSLLVLKTTERIVEHYNYFRYLAIPIAVRYEFPTDGGLGLFLEGGASLNVWKKATGKTLDWELAEPEEIGVANGGADWHRPYLYPEFFAGVGLKYALRDGLDLWAHPQFRYRPWNNLPESYPMVQKTGSFGLNIGLRWRLGE